MEIFQNTKKVLNISDVIFHADISSGRTFSTNRTLPLTVGYAAHILHYAQLNDFSAFSHPNTEFNISCCTKHFHQTTGNNTKIPPDLLERNSVSTRRKSVCTKHAKQRHICAEMEVRGNDLHTHTTTENHRIKHVQLSGICFSPRSTAHKTLSKTSTDKYPGW